MWALRFVVCACACALTGALASSPELLPHATGDTSCSEMLPVGPAGHLLRVAVSRRGEESHSLTMLGEFMELWRAAHPLLRVVHRDPHDIPHLSLTELEAMGLTSAQQVRDRLDR